MIRFISIISIVFSLVSGQSDSAVVSKFTVEGIECKLNTISGIVTDSTNGQPVEEAYVNIFTGNKILKHTLLTDENGYFSQDNIGYLWKPKIQFLIDNYKKKSFRLDPALLDTSDNIRVNCQIVPLPNNEIVQNLDKSTITKRAELFFIKGNVFYNYYDLNYAEQVIINSVEAIELKKNHIALKINNKMYDVSKCYVPQNGRYENLSFILRSLLGSPIFKESGLPKFLPEPLLMPTVIFGSVIDSETNQMITGAEIILTKYQINKIHENNEQKQLVSMANYNAKSKNHTNQNKNALSTYKRRLSDKNGKFAFSVSNPGTYQLEIKSPEDYRKSYSGNPSIIVQYGRGGWYQTTFYLKHK